MPREVINYHEDYEKKLGKHRFPIVPSIDVWPHPFLQAIAEQVIATTPLNWEFLGTSIEKIQVMKGKQIERDRVEGLVLELHLDLLLKNIAAWSSSLTQAAIGYYSISSFKHIMLEDEPFEARRVGTLSQMDSQQRWYRFRRSGDSGQSTVVEIRNKNQILHDYAEYDGVSVVHTLLEDTIPVVWEAKINTRYDGKLADATMRVIHPSVFRYRFHPLTQRFHTPYCAVMLVTTSDIMKPYFRNEAPIQDYENAGGLLATIPYSLQAYKEDVRRWIFES